MRTSSIVGEPEIDGEAVVVRVAVEDTDVETTAEIFVCRMTDYGNVSVEAFPRGLTPSSDGVYRAEAAAAALRHVLANRETFDPLFAVLEPTQTS